MSNLTFNRYNYKKNSNNYIFSLYLDLIKVNIPDDIINIILDYTTSLAGILEYTLTGHTGQVKCLLTLPNGDLVSGSSDNSIKIWKDRNLINTLNGHIYTVSCLAVLLNGDLVSGSYDNTIKIWRNNLVIKTLIEHT